MVKTVLAQEDSASPCTVLSLHNVTYTLIGGEEGNVTLNQNVHRHLKINLLISPVQNERDSIIR